MFNIKYIYIYIHIQYIYIYMSMYVSFWSNIPMFACLWGLAGVQRPRCRSLLLGLDLMAMENHLVFWYSLGKEMGKSFNEWENHIKSHVSQISWGIQTYFKQPRKLDGDHPWPSHFDGEASPFPWPNALRRSAPWAAQIRRSSRNLRCIWIRMEAIEQLGWARATWNGVHFKHMIYSLDLSGNFTSRYWKSLN